MSLRVWTEPNFKHQQPTRKRIKGRKARAEATVKTQVRAECVARDGHCLVATRAGIEDECKGRSVWCHLRGHRRSRTRGMAPEKRHNTMFTGMLCTKHHNLEERGKYVVVYRSTDYANGPLSWEPREQKAA